MVDAPAVFDHPAVAVARQVAGAVQPLAVAAERVGHEALGRQRRATMVTTRQALATEHQLAHGHLRQGFERRAKDVRVQVGDRLADRHAVTPFVDTGPVGDVDRCLGRPVQVVQAGTGQVAEHLLLGVHRQRLAAADHLPHAVAALQARFTDEHLQHRRHEMQSGDLVALDGVDQPLRLAMLARRRQGQPCTGHQRPEEFPHRHVEAERGFLQHRVGAVQRIRLLHPRQPVIQRQVAVAGAFRPPGRAGGVDDVGQVLGVQPARRHLPRVPAQFAGLVQQKDLPGKRRQLLAQVRLGQQQFDAAVFKHVGQPLGRVVRVQRYIGGAGFKDRQQANDHFQRALGGDTHQAFRADTLFDQLVRPLAGQLAQRPIAHALVAEQQCRGVWLATRLRLEQLVHAPVAGVVGGGVVKVMQHRLRLLRAQHRQLAHRLLRLGYHTVQQMLPMLPHALDAWCVEQVGGVGQRCPQAIRDLDRVQGQVELGVHFFPRQHFHAQAWQLCGPWQPALGAAMVEHDLEQRAAVQAPFDLQRVHQLLEGQVLVRLGLQRSSLDLLQQADERLVRIDVGLVHLGIDEEADQAFGFLAGAVGDRHADADVRLPGVAVQQALEGRQQQHEQGHPFAPCQLPQAIGQCRAQWQVDAGATVAAVQRPRAVAGQRQHRLFTAQLGGPVG